jgi:hypothetical protein
MVSSFLGFLQSRQCPIALQRCQANLCRAWSYADFPQASRDSYISLSAAKLSLIQKIYF